jgi:dipeptidase E
MNIVLTSAGFKNPTVRDELIKLLPKPPRELKLAHVTTASHVAPDTDFVSRDRVAMQQCGFQVVEVALEDLTPETCLEELKKFDVIYVQGGSGYYLLKQARACGFEAALRQLLKDDEKWYIGVSAGSYIACPTIKMHGWKQEKNTYGLTDLDGMNLVPFLVSVHYNREKYRENLAEHIPGAGYPVRILTDDQALYVRGDNVRLLGKKPEIMADNILHARVTKNSTT